MKKVITLAVTLVLVLALTISPAFAAEKNIDPSIYSGTYLLAEDERVEITPFMFVPDKEIKFYLIISEESGIFLQYGDLISHVEDYVYLGEELYVSFQDIVEAFDAFKAVNDCVDYFVSASRFEIAE